VTTRYALIGTGSRAEMYVRSLLEDHADVARLVAIADVNDGRLAYYSDLITELSAGSVQVSRWRADQVAEMIAAESVDRVIITSPDYTHAGIVVTALEAGADVVVEKPLTIDAASASAIARAVDETGHDVVATFNYRYSPRNTELKRVIASGAIGQPTSVHFEWVLDTSHGADYFRRWHRDKANSGGLLVHKASHHFDLVNWWIDDVPERVYARGALRFYGRENAEARGLDARPERGTVDRVAPDPFLLDLRDDDKLRRLYLDNESYDGYRRDQDVFSDGITIEDNISVLVDYASGATMSYSLNAHGPWEGYRIAVNGTEGRVELEVVERGALPLAEDGHTVIDPSAVADKTDDDVRPRSERLVLQRHWERPRVIPIPAGEGGHGGGDTIMLSDILVGHGEDPLRRPADYLDGMRAIAVGIAANRSIATGEPVQVADLGLGVDLATGERSGSEAGVATR
jgi:predicted dehydrogenase